MSILTMRTIKCDGIDCNQWIYESDETADILRRMAKREGWKRARIYRDGRPTVVGDFCPDCLGDVAPNAEPADEPKATCGDSGIHPGWVCDLPPGLHQIHRQRVPGGANTWTHHAEPATTKIEELRQQVQDLEHDLRIARARRDEVIRDLEESSLEQERYRQEALDSARTAGRLMRENREHIVEVPRNHMDRLRGWLEHPNGALVLNRVTLESVEHGGILIRTRPYTAPTHEMPGMWETADLVGGQTDCKEDSRGTTGASRNPGSPSADDAGA